MYCEECKKRPATVHYTQVVNGKKIEMHLCEECASQKSAINLDFNFEPGFSIQNFLSGLIGGATSGYSKPVGRAIGPEVTCETCGLTFSQFVNGGRLGCSDCYSAFREQLMPVIRRVHGSNYHTGKVPRRTGGILYVKREIEGMRAELQKAIESEEYEQAAALRDRIREMEQKVEKQL